MRFTVRSIKYRDWKERLHYGVKSFCFKSSLYLKSSSKMQLFKYFIKPSCKKCSVYQFKSYLKSYFRRLLFPSHKLVFSVSFSTGPCPRPLPAQARRAGPSCWWEQSSASEAMESTVHSFQSCLTGHLFWSSVSFPWATG